MSLKKSFFLLTLCGLVLALGLALALWCRCGAAISQYPAGGFVIDLEGRISPLPEPTREEMRLRTGLEILRLAGCALLPVLGLGLAAALFYRWKLKPPIAALSEGIKRIQAHDLDFVIPQTPQDELGQVCTAFEIMRRELLQTNRELWRQAEERKRLNAAFAHNLRNPITVLKGSVQLLQQNSGDERAAATLDRLRTYTLRIEQYVEAMSSIQGLEQLAVRPTSVPYAALGNELAETGRWLAPALCWEIAAPKAGSALIDQGLFLTVAENLLGNAARFAKSRVSVGLAAKGDWLLLSVSDDGPGFGPQLLKDGPRPFAKGEEAAGHFGMGLYSSLILCQKHGGSLVLANSEAGGAAVTASLKINP